jgi:hypothetical protein
MIAMVISAALVCSNKLKGPELIKNYKTGAQLKEMADKLVLNCGCSSKEIISTSPEIIAYTVKKCPEEIPEAMRSKVQKVFLLFGEHPRELLSPQTGIKFMEFLCRKATLAKMDDTNSLNKNIFKIILNANPNGKAYLEANTNDSKKMSKRSNTNDVDLNRNWSLGFKKFTLKETVSKMKLDQTYGGEEAFSEPETVALKNSLTDFKPRIFLSLHSGMESLFIPYGYLQTAVEGNNLNDLMSVSDEIKKNYCPKCTSGSLSSALGYASGGNCLDYAYDCVGAPYAFAWEIYNGPAASTGIEQFAPNGLFTINDITANWIKAIDHMTTMIYKREDNGERRKAVEGCKAPVKKKK